MALSVALKHITGYRFDRPVHLSPHEVRLRPAPHCRTPILSYSLKVEPAEHSLRWHQDLYGNYVGRLAIAGETTRLEFAVGLVADLTPINPFDFVLEEDAAAFPFSYAPPLSSELAPFLQVEPSGERFRDYLARERAALSSRTCTVDLLVEANRHLCAEVEYVARREAGIQPCEETLQRRSGSCRDSAWLLIQVLRRFGLAARFVSGYLIQLSSPAESARPGLPRGDFADLHAWAEAYLPGAGWIGFDPTSGLVAGEGHIPLACSADPGRAAPVTGSTDACESRLEFAVSVERIRTASDRP